MQRYTFKVFCNYTGRIDKAVKMKLLQQRSELRQLEAENPAMLLLEQLVEALEK